MLKVNNIQKSFASNEVLRGASFEVPLGTVVGLVGPSGGGKSVLLKVIGGVISADAGEVLLIDNGASKKNIATGFLFQEGALFDSMTVLENVSFPLLSNPVSKPEQRKDLCSDSLYQRAA
ncbi:hypothetical protein BVY02_00195, partial [bacterium J17]